MDPHQSQQHFAMDNMEKEEEEKEERFTCLSVQLYKGSSVKLILCKWSSIIASLATVLSLTGIFASLPWLLFVLNKWSLTSKETLTSFIIIMSSLLSVGLIVLSLVSWVLRATVNTSDDQRKKKQSFYVVERSVSISSTCTTSSSSVINILDTPLPSTSSSAPPSYEEAISVASK